MDLWPARQDVERAEDLDLRRAALTLLRQRDELVARLGGAESIDPDLYFALMPSD